MVSAMWNQRLTPLNQISSTQMSRGLFHSGGSPRRLGEWKFNCNTKTPTIASWHESYWSLFSPARWYVSFTLKMILAHLLLNYDIKLANEKASHIFTWTTAIVPRFSTRIMIRRRESWSRNWVLRLISYSKFSRVEGEGRVSDPESAIDDVRSFGTLWENAIRVGERR